MFSDFIENMKNIYVPNSDKVIFNVNKNVTLLLLLLYWENSENFYF